MVVEQIFYWRRGFERQNFGDFLSELLLEALLRDGFSSVKHDAIYLIGSVISERQIQFVKERLRGKASPSIAFWGCGVRDQTPLSRELLRDCEFLGVRGPLTLNILGLPTETPIGDSALLLPHIYRPKVSAAAGRTICMPHFYETKSDDELLALTRADLIVRPDIPNDVEALREVIDAIAGADFVLSGALHGAIVACAYGKPFAYFDSGYIDLPFKWQDFSASVNVPCRFAKSVAGGRAIYCDEIHPVLRLPPPLPILACAPISPSLSLLHKVASSPGDISSNFSDCKAIQRKAAYSSLTP